MSASALPATTQQPMRLDARAPVVLFANALGDHLLALPALRALAKMFPRRLRLLGLPEQAALFFGDVEFQSIIPLTVERVLPGRGIEFNVDQVFRAIGESDLFMSLVPWHTPSVDGLLQLLGNTPSVGFFAGYAECLPLRYDKHSYDLAFDLPRYFDPSLRIEDFSGPPAVAHNSRLRGAMAGYRKLVIHADTQPAKMWKWNSFTRVLGRFFETHPEFIGLLIGMPHDHDAGELGDYLAPCLGVSIPETLAIIETADLFLGVDSCFLHAADLFRVPGVGLFGPTNPDEFGFRFAAHRHVYGNGSMDAIPEEEVAAALHELSYVC